MVKKKSAFDRVLKRSKGADEIFRLNDQALMLLQQGQFQAGANLLRQSLAHNPKQIEVLYNLGFALQNLGEIEAAVIAYGRVLRARPDDVEALMARGHVLATQRNYSEALADFSKVVTLVPHLADGWNNLGNVLLELKREKEAVEAFDKALALRPQYKQAWFNKGKALYEEGSYVASGDAYEQALNIDPHYAEAQWHLSWIRLSFGDFERGWCDYEARWYVAALGYVRRYTDKPLWLGAESLSGKTVLLHAEQGLGDAIQFCRYALLLMQKGARVFMEVHESLISLMQTLHHEVHVFRTGMVSEDFDFHCPLMSMPLATGTRLDTVPNKVPYLSADQVKVKGWLSRLPIRQLNKKRVGLVWSGSTGHKNDANRSMSLEQLAPLFDIDAEFICLQPELREVDQNWLNSKPNVSLARFPLHDFSDTAALVENLDLVISVDTSVAHLAGALGKPVWIFVSSDPDFRWLLEREDSPWYPTARLFRQKERGNWTEVLSRVVTELKTFSEARTDTLK